MTNTLPNLGSIEAKSLEERAGSCQTVQDARDAFCELTDDRKALFFNHTFFEAHLQYFATFVEPAAAYSHPICGSITRSVGCAAFQNKDIFRPWTDSFEFIWSVLEYAYPELYEQEYQEE